MTSVKASEQQTTAWLRRTDVLIWPGCASGQQMTEHQ